MPRAKQKSPPPAAPAVIPLRKCHNCQWWRARRDELQIAGAPRTGECHGAPPSAERQFGDTTKMHMTWPVTFEGEDCGHWTPRTEEPRP